MVRFGGLYLFEQHYLPQKLGLNCEEKLAFTALLKGHLNLLIPFYFVFGGSNTSFKVGKKASLQFRKSQQRLINSVNKIPFPNLFDNLNFQLKNRNRFNCVISQICLSKRHKIM